MIILGISLGTRTSGIAILDNGKLVVWNTLSFRKRWTERKAERIISKYNNYLKTHKVTAVVLKIPPFTHHTDAIAIILKQLQEILAYHGCMVVYKTKEEIKGILPQVRNTKDLIDYTVQLYPALIPEHSQEIINKNNYHHKMFEAVLVAHMWKTERQKEELHI